MSSTFVSRNITWRDQGTKCPPKNQQAKSTTSDKSKSSFPGKSTPVLERHRGDAHGSFAPRDCVLQKGQYLQEGFVGEQQTQARIPAPQPQLLGQSLQAVLPGVRPRPRVQHGLQDVHSVCNLHALPASRVPGGKSGVEACPAEVPKKLPSHRRASPTLLPTSTSACLLARVA